MVQKGVPISNLYLYTHHFKNNKPSVWLYFKLETDNSQQRTKYVQKCTNMTPKMVSNAQMNIVKNVFNKMINMKFAKKSSKVNYLISTVLESLNVTVKLNQNFKEEI